MLKLCKSVDLNYCNVSNAFIEHLNNMGNAYENIDEHNPNKNTRY